ncbi:hypothetical protein [Silvanigrella aquatica]|uniref:Uncharacterized protein n=1 Tax=Silvanigrella aquatica TaxID=1915309 RepID=A0A1L4D2R1_9BACT|nr:hypothetical protein [Silvanigrella aquatica]APJ04477.1 hypothetical protein AXG55_11380 [Silvanigrella aquatica]
MKVIKFLISTITFFNAVVPAFSQEVSINSAYVYCADENKNWHWLDDGETKIEGQWLKFSIEKNSLTYTYYFIVGDSLDKIENLRKECQKKFGKEFHYAQPATINTLGWYRFATHNLITAPGHISYGTNVPRRDRQKNSGKFRNPPEFCLFYNDNKG